MFKATKRGGGSVFDVTGTPTNRPVTVSEDECLCGLSEEEMVTNGDKFSKNVRNESWLTLLEVNFLKILRTIMFQQLLTPLRFFNHFKYNNVYFNLNKFLYFSGMKESLI